MFTLDLLAGFGFLILMNMYNAEGNYYTALLFGGGALWFFMVDIINKLKKGKK
jgi:hypothetical protein